MSNTQDTEQTGTASASNAGPPRAGGFLAGMRIRKKLIVLHTCFSLILAAILLLALNPAISRIVETAESHKARVVLAVVLAEVAAARDEPRFDHVVDRIRDVLPETVDLRIGPAEEIGIDDADAAQTRRSGRAQVRIDGGDGEWTAAHEPAGDIFVAVRARQPEARSAVTRLYILMTLALLAVYGFVAAALEIFVLPQHVYGPIRAIQRADNAVQEGRIEDELIPESAIPADELGEIMRSRNRSLLSIRKHERDLAAALSKIEEVATDLRRKNHLLETAKRNLADADRLASLGMMSAGIAHELNTPLAVLKGLVERLHTKGPSSINPDEAALMLRVVGRLERLSESLLDFARVRAPVYRPVVVRDLVEEAWTLVRLDREARDARLETRLPADLVVECDADRMLQVLVNLLRNAVDAMETVSDRTRRITAEADVSEREGKRWVSLVISDTGPGIDPALIESLFEPFVSSRLDSRGTGLGLAVAQGIVREHGGVLLARNRPDASGAMFEIMLPLHAEPIPARPDPGRPTDQDVN